MLKLIATSYNDLAMELSRILARFQKGGLLASDESIAHQRVLANPHRATVCYYCHKALVCTTVNTAIGILLDITKSGPKCPFLPIVCTGCMSIISDCFIYKDDDLNRQ